MNNSSDHDENKWGNTYGLSPQFLESLGINSPLTNRVFVANVSTLELLYLVHKTCVKVYYFKFHTL